MGRLGNALFLVAMFAAPAFAAEMPTRKAGEDCKDCIWITAMQLEQINVFRSELLTAEQSALRSAAFIATLYSMLGWYSRCKVGEVLLGEVEGVQEW